MHPWKGAFASFPLPATKRLRNKRRMGQEGSLLEGIRLDSRSKLPDRAPYMLWLLFGGALVAAIAESGDTAPYAASIATVYAWRLAAMAGLVLVHYARPRSYRCALFTTLSAALVLLLTSALTASIRGDYASVTALTAALSVGTAALVPWGGLAQIALVVPTVAAIAISYVIDGGPVRDVFVSPAFTTANLAAFTSIYLAFRLERYYEEVETLLQAAIEADERQRNYRKLLDAMRHAELRYLGERSAARAFGTLLDSLLELTDSPIGLVAEVRGDNGDRTLLCHAHRGFARIGANLTASDPAGNGMPPTVRDLDSLVAAPLVSRRPILRNDVADDRPLAGEDFEHPPVHAILTLPVFVGDTLVGVVAIANRDGGYDDEWIEYLQPLVTTCSHLLNALRDERGREEAERKVRRLNADLESRVEQRTAALKTALNEIESFSYTVSHDLRSPLRAMHGYSRMLREEYGPLLDDTGRGYLGRLEGGAIRMGRLIDDVLSLARVSRHVIETREVDLAAVAGHIVSDLREAEPERNVTVEIEPSIPAECDPTLAQLVLENLIGNAWKFTRREEHAEIFVGVRSQHGSRVFFVADNGAGFDMEHARNMFQPFQRLHPEDEFEGTGIGLATVRRIVERHGGTVWAESAPDAGATFSFTLGQAAAAPVAASA